MALITDKKLNQIRDTFKTSYQILKLVWGVDRVLFTGTAVSMSIPAVLPFINIYIYKLIIDQVVAVAGGASFNSESFYLLIVIRFITYLAQELSTNIQNYIQVLLWTKVPIHLNQLFLGKITSLIFNILKTINLEI